MGNVEPIAAADTERSKRFVRGLIPRAVVEAGCMGAGLGAYLATGQFIWLAVAVAAGGLPVVLYILKFAGENREAQALTRAPAGRSIVE